MDQKATAVEQNRSIQINWGMFNVPTLIAVGTIFFYGINNNSQQDFRLDQIEKLMLDQQSARNDRIAQTNQRFNAIESKILPLENLQYRLTVSESGLGDVNRRVDRQTDSMQGIRDDVASISTQIELLRQTIEQAFAPNGRVTKPPPEYTK